MRAVIPALRLMQTAALELPAAPSTSPPVTLPVKQEPSVPASPLVLTSRAVCVPHQAANPGTERITTVNLMPPMRWPPRHEQLERIPEHA
jgi:hypothetical protein